MPEFKNREEYEKWKAEKIKSNEERAQKLKEEERLKNKLTLGSGLYGLLPKSSREIEYLL